MILHTKLPLKPSNHPVNHNLKVLLLGSCFSENIGDKFSYFKFQSLSNPFGILFHPLAIEQLITNAVNQKVYSEEDIFNHNEQWHCFESHSRLSNPSEAVLLKSLNENIEKTLQFLETASYIIITLGTAWAYRFIETDAFVANCHKVPQNKFLKELLSAELISESLEAIVSLVQQINPDVKFIFTVSPVRHIKDGFIENTRSKAHLISGIHDYLSNDSSSSGYYFPSYEIMMDELRDYRFYKADMLHPSDTAVSYIWERFQEVFISEETKQVMKEVADIQKGMAHRAVNPISVAHQTFLQQLESKKSVLVSKFPQIEF